MTNKTLHTKCSPIFKKSIFGLLIVFYVFMAGSELLAQEKKTDDLKNFKIIVMKTDNGIKIQSVQGSAWKDLSFNLNPGRLQAVDEYGMTTLDQISSHKDAHLADFLFTITTKENSIVLQGIEGTAWKDLSFSVRDNEKQAIDQYGMTSLH